MVSIVAKASTKSGEFFCFQCGKQVQDEADSCESCGSAFDRITEAFRCPRCSKLLPVGSAICPSCALRFKVKAVHSSQKMTEDDRFLMKLIDWGREKKAPERAARPGKGTPIEKPAIVAKGAGTVISAGSKSAEAASEARATLAQIGLREIIRQESPDLLEYLKKTEEDLRIFSDESMKSLEELKEYIENKAVEVGGAFNDELKQLFNQLESGLSESSRLEDDIEQLKKLIRNALPETHIPEPEAVSPEEDESDGLSKQALKKLLEQREKEVEMLRKQEEQLNQREELLNRKIRGYAIKKKQMEKAEQELESKKKALMKTIAEAQLQGRPGIQASVKGTDEWLEDQSKIKMGLLEIRNEMSSGDDSMKYFPSQMSSETMEKLEVLEEKLADVRRERDELDERVKEFEAIRKDVITLLKVLDQLLGKLPPATISEFSKSKYFSLYEKVLDKLNI